MRSCLPFTILSQQLVDNAELGPALKRELTIRETERCIIEDTPKWPWWGTVGELQDTKFYTDVDFNALELRLLAQNHVSVTDRMKRFELDAHWIAGLYSTGTYVHSLRCGGKDRRVCHPRATLPFRVGYLHEPDTRRFVHNYDDLFTR